MTGRRCHPAELSREDDVFFRPGVRALAVRTGRFVLFELRIAPGFFFDRLSGRRQLRGGRASHKDSFNHGVVGLVCCPGIY